MATTPARAPASLVATLEKSAPVPPVCEKAATAPPYAWQPACDASALADAVQASATPSTRAPADFLMAPPPFSLPGRPMLRRGGGRAMRTYVRFTRGL